MKTVIRLTYFSQDENGKWYLTIQRTEPLPVDLSKIGEYQPHLQQLLNGNEAVTDALVELNALHAMNEVLLMDPDEVFDVFKPTDYLLQTQEFSDAEGACEWKRCLGKIEIVAETEEIFMLKTPSHGNDVLLLGRFKDKVHMLYTLLLLAQLVSASDSKTWIAPEKVLRITGVIHASPLPTLSTKHFVPV